MTLFIASANIATLGIKNQGYEGQSTYAGYCLFKCEGGANTLYATSELSLFTHEAKETAVNTKKSVLL